MVYRKHEIVDRAKTEPKKVAEEILEQYRETGCHRRKAAVNLGIHDSTLVRLIQDIDVLLKGKLSADMEAMEAKAIEDGWHHSRNRRGGRPIGSKDSYQRTRSSKAKKEKKK